MGSIGVAKYAAWPYTLAMPTNIGAGSITPIVSDSTRPTNEGAAIPVYLYTSGNAGAGSAVAVRFISASELRANGGKYALEGLSVAIPVIVVTGRPVQGGSAIPVYDVTSLNWPSQGSGADPSPPSSGDARVTELGDDRITDALDTRITE